MGRDATKAAGNPWYQARKKAAEYDDRLCSRESAAEQLGMSVPKLGGEWRTASEEDIPDGYDG